MTAVLTDNLPLLAGAPTGIKKLRELILELAVRGKLVPQDPNDEPANELLERIAGEKAGLVAEGKIKKQKPLTEITEEEKPFGLPSGWQWVRLAKGVVKLTDGEHLSPPKAASGMPLLTAKDVTDSGVLFESTQFVTVENGLKYRERCNPDRGDILICSRGTIGRCAAVETDQVFCLMGSVILVKPSVNTFYRYMLRYLQTTLAQQWMLGASSATAVSALYLKDVANCLVPLPPLAEQHRIITKVDELMALCGRLEAQQADAESAHAQLVQALLDSLTQTSDATDFATNWQRLAEHFHTLFTTESSIDALKQTLLQLAVMGKLVPQDPSHEPASELLQRIAEEKTRLVAEGKIKKQKTFAAIGEEEKAFKLPKGWQWARKAEIFSFLNGYAFKSQWFRPEGIRLLRNVNISHGAINWKETACISEEKAAEFIGFLLEENDVVLTLDRPIISTGLKYAVIRSADLPCLLLQRVAKIAPYSGAVAVSYLSAWLNSRFFVDYIDPGRSNGVPHISTNQIASMPFALPPLEEQHRIVAKADQLMALCDQLKTRLTQSRQINEQLASTLVEQATN